MIKLISWNVNGIRAAIKKGFIEFLDKYDPDVICLQETKAMPEQVDIVLNEYPHKFWNSAEKKGYSGTAIFSKIKPMNYFYDLGIEEHDKEGRVITLEFQDYFSFFLNHSIRQPIRTSFQILPHSFHSHEHLHKAHF